MASFKVTRELHPTPQAATTAAPNRIWAHAYTAAAGTAMMEIRQDGLRNMLEVWRSEDNGAIWRMTDEVPARERLAHGLNIWRTPGPLHLDPTHDVLLRFWREQLVTDVFFDMAAGFARQIKGLLKNNARMYYEISRDAGYTWSRPVELRTAQMDAETAHLPPHPQGWGNPMRIVELPPFPRLDDGAILFPVQGSWPRAADRFGDIQTGCLRAAWNLHAGDLDWECFGRIPGGGCEPAIARLRDGRILAIIRAQGLINPYFWEAPDLRPFSISEDGGKTWSTPRPLYYSDGGPFASPRAMSHLIRSARNGRLYWLANIIPAATAPSQSALSPARCDPRWPFQIIEVDEDGPRLKRETLTVIETKTPDEQYWTRFSNARVYEDRVTGEIVVLMMKAYCELAEGLPDLPCPNHRYRITLPA